MGDNQANGKCSHAEGYGCTADGTYSHAEGSITSAGGACSHAEGSGTRAKGTHSHTEGDNSVAYGECAHAEGRSNVALGAYSHAEGCYNTANENQHVEGKWSVEDTTSAHIIGGGTDANNRKNIHTVDWDGNADYAGDVVSHDSEGNAHSLNAKANATAVEEIQTRLTTDEASIKANATNIATNTSDIKANNVAVETVKKDIEAVKESVATNTSDITQLQSRIETLKSGLTDFTSFAQISNVIKAGYASSTIPVGTQILTKLDGNGYTVDEFAWDVVHHFDGSDDDHPLVTLADGSQVKGMMLQAHRTVPWSIVWQPVEAAIAVTGDMPAGTYHFTVTITAVWGSGVAKAVGSTTYQFTTANDLTAGAQLVWNASYSAALSKLTVYSGPSSTAVVETCAVTVGSDGTDLGTMTDGTPSTNSQSYAALNNIERACEGSNRWRTSQMREALNCTGTVAQGGDSFSRPWGLVGKSGLPACLPAEFVKVLGEVERKQELHPWDGASTIETTHDTFFPVSAREHGFNNYLSASSDGFKAEGVPLDYWTKLRTASGRTAWDGWSTYPELITYDSVAPTTARYVWLRSAYRYASTAHGVGCVYTSGYVNYNGANSGNFAAPACIIV